MEKREVNGTEFQSHKKLSISSLSERVVTPLLEENYFTKIYIFKMGSAICRSLHLQKPKKVVVSESRNIMKLGNTLDIYLVVPA